MNLQAIHEKQRELDDYIHVKHGLTRDQTYNDRIEALSMEIAEFINDTNYCKYWKQSKEPKPTLLEEGADILHFVPSLANDYGAIMELNHPELGEGEEVGLLHRTMQGMTLNLYDRTDVELVLSSLEAILNVTVNLLRRYGYTDEQIEEAYFAKARKNEERQDNGY